LRIYADSCERCMNVLIHKYSDNYDGDYDFMDDGYAEFSDDWFKANTNVTLKTLTNY